MTAFRIRATEVRKAADMVGDRTLRSISERTGIHRISLTGLMNGRRAPGLTTVKRFYDVYGMPLEKIIEEVGEGPSVAKDAA